MTSRTLTIVMFVVAACEPSAPDQISYQRDVAPIVKANCLRCHAYPAVLAPAELRWDSFEPTDIIDPADPAKTMTISGISQHGAQIAKRIVHPTRPMPPKYPLDDYQLEILVRWTEPATRVPEGEPFVLDRGEPRPGNHLPTIELLEVSVHPGGVVLRVLVSDEDDEVVAGTLRATGGSLVQQTLVGTLRSGVQDIRWDHPAGTYSFTADLDDGASADRTPVFVAGGVEVP